MFTALRNEYVTLNFLSYYVLHNRWEVNVLYEETAEWFTKLDNITKCSYRYRCSINRVDIQ
jgi:hypothetical protein